MAWEPPKKFCGHEVGYKCCCHPLTSKSRSVGDMTDYFKRPYGQRLARQPDQEFQEFGFLDEEADDSP